MVRKHDITRDIKCVYLGPDFNSIDGVWLLNLDTGRLISRRKYKIFEGFPFLSHPSNVVSLTSLLRSLEIIRNVQDEKYNQACEALSEDEDDYFHDRDVEELETTQ